MSQRSYVFRDDVRAEVKAAQAKHPPLHSFHEGIAVLMEEFEEAKAEVWKSKCDPEALRAELVQVAAMAERIALDLIDEPPAAMCDHGYGD